MSRSRKVVCALIATSWLANACTMQSYAPSTDAATREIKIKTGDQIRVVTTRREQLAFAVTEIRGDRLIGVTVEPLSPKEGPAGKMVAVPLDELAVVQVTRFNPGAAVLAVLTMTALGAVIGAAAVPAFPAATLAP